MQDNLFSLQNKVALITGASSGLGEHFAHVLADAGATVVLCARRASKLNDVVSNINSNGGNAIAIEMDVTDKSSIEQALQQTYETAGAIDVLVNNAGVAKSAHSLKADEANYDFIVDTNLKGAWMVATEVARHMVAQQTRGSIINIASILGLRVGFGESTYGISKAGVVQMTKSMALELASKNIRVNALCPGYFKTDINASFFNTEKGEAFINNTPAKRLGKINELSGPLLLLASEAGSFINGAALPVDGGHLVSSL